ncbi:DUF2730 family protein [Citrobacter freundii]|nr:DUF2730 family protein [Citrobacter freundii]MBC6508309.1 DUF2730 family protein [Citrobacter freundii]
MVIDVIKNYWPIIWALLMTGVNVIQLLLVKTYVRHSTFNDLALRVVNVESAIKQLPAPDELHRLELEISSLRGDIRELGQALRKVSRISDLLLENELKERN